MSKINVKRFKKSSRGGGKRLESSLQRGEEAIVHERLVSVTSAGEGEIAAKQLRREAARFLDAKMPRGIEAKSVTGITKSILAPMAGEEAIVHERLVSVTSAGAGENQNVIIQSNPSPEFLNSLPFIKKFYPTPLWGEGKLIKVTHENSSNSRHSEALQSRKNPAYYYNTSKLKGIHMKNLASKNLAAWLPSRLAAKRVAFTLAEVLITLGIIGVVAAMTLPALIQNHQKQTYVAGLQKAMSTTSNMFKKMQADEGVDFYNTKLFSEGVCEWKIDWDYNIQQPINVNDCEDFYGNPSIFENIIPKYLKVVKTCKGTDCNIRYTTTFLSCTNNKCTLTDYTNGTNKTPKEVLGILGVDGRYVQNITGFYTNDGMVFYIFPAGNYFGIGVLADINGEKGPNKLYRDLFFYFYRANGEIAGTYQDNFAGPRVMTNGWKMDY